MQDAGERWEKELLTRFRLESLHAFDLDAGRSAGEGSEMITQFLRSSSQWFSLSWRRFAAGGGVDSGVERPPYK